MKKFYLTFGSAHIHTVGGKTFDKDCVVEISAETYEKARKIAFNVFSDKWCFMYKHLKNVEVERYYPRGVIVLG